MKSGLPPPKVSAPYGTLQGVKGEAWPKEQREGLQGALDSIRKLGGRLRKSKERSSVAPGPLGEAGCKVVLEQRASS